MELHYIDTHAHLEFTEYTEDRPAVIQRANSIGVSHIISVATREQHFKKTLELALAYDSVYAALGIHPHEAAGILTDQKDTTEKINELIATIKGYLSYDKVVSIGEIGIDFYKLAREPHSQRTSIRDVQEQLFRAQMELAIDVDVPVMIHCRSAYPEMLKILRSYAKATRLHGMLHSFEGDLKTAEEFMKLGLKLSYSGMVTYEQSRDYIEAIKNIPLTEMLLETDCPYLSPEPLRGQRNEPVHIEYVAKKIASLRGISTEEVARTTTQNAKELFNIT